MKEGDESYKTGQKDQESRVCTKCLQEKPLTLKYWRSMNPKICRSCQNDATRDWQRSNPERHAETCRKWAGKNKEKTRKASKLSYKKRSKQLSDSFVAQRLRSKGITDTPELIKIERERMQMKRLIKQIKEARNGTDSARN